MCSMRPVGGFPTPSRLSRFDNVSAHERSRWCWRRSRSNTAGPFSFQRVERPMVVTERSGLTREEAIRAIETVRVRAGESPR